MSKYNDVLSLWKSYKINAPSDLDVYLDNFRILFAFNSGKIENDNITYHDTREIFENGKISSFSGDIRSLFEQSNQKLCYEFLKEKIVRKQPLSIGLIKDIHLILTSGTYDEHRFINNGERSGEFKKHDYVTGINEVGAAPEDVAFELQELLDELNEHTGSDKLKLATYLHARFEYIHPFADGNGRVGRTLLNYYLMINDHPPMIIYNEDKADYYNALEKYDSEEELVPLYNFLKYEVEKTWSKQLELSLNINLKPKRQNLDELIQNAKKKSEQSKGNDSSIASKVSEITDRNIR